MILQTFTKAHTSFNLGFSYRSPSPFSIRSFSTHRICLDTRASSQLYTDAQKEEDNVETGRLPRSPAPSTQPIDYPNWTGDERVEDAVLRMLLDKYKPLRGGVIKSADEKLKSLPPRDSLRPPSLPELPSNDSSSPSSSSTTALVAEGSNTTDKPWLTTFRAPSNNTSIRYMRVPPLPPTKTSGQGSSAIHPDDSRTRIMERERKKKAAHAGRLTNARETSLDYRIGRGTTGSGHHHIHRPNPVGLKGWTNLVEERIERARKEGHFRYIKGRGKPLVRENEQTNPFIPREEFLLNRIVQRQGAAPPWVEYQGELETAITSFRNVLQSTWTRRAVRALMLEHSPGVLSRFTISDVTGSRMRDREWEAREKGYHEEALREINALVRKYNGVAPYSVRRTYLNREAELDRMYEASGAEILGEIRRAAAGGGSPMGGAGSGERDTGSCGYPKPIGFLRNIWNKWVLNWIRA